MGLHAGGRPKLAVGPAPGLFEYGRGSAGDEVPWFPGHQAQPVPGTQHRESSLPTLEVHGHRPAARTRKGDRSMTGIGASEATGKPSGASEATGKPCAPTETPEEIDIPAL